MSNTNRSVTLVGANKIFSAVDIEIVQSSLGFYESKGLIEIQKPTLTELCQEIAVRLRKL